MTTLGYIIAANLVSTLVSVGLAALLSFRYLAQVIDRLVPVSAGLLLATAVTHLLPEAFHSEANPHALGWVLLGGILGFFLLEKLALIHHTHHHEGDHHHHEHGHDAHEAGRGGLPILVGDAFHNFGLVQTKDGLIHRVVPGNHLGQNDGRITAVSDARIALVEIVPDGMGGYIERQAALALSD